MTLLDDARAAVADEHSRDQLSTEGDREIRLARALLELDGLIEAVRATDAFSPEVNALLAYGRSLRGGL